MRCLRKFVALFSLPILILAGCGSTPSFNSQLSAAVSPYRFSIIKWEISSLSQEIGEALSDKDKASPEGSQTVVDYFALMDKINAERSAVEAITSGITSGDISTHLKTLDDLTAQLNVLSTQAEFVLEAQLKATLESLGIYNPLDGRFKFRSIFPPIKLRLQEPPKLLVVSPRTEIERLATITLDSNISLDNSIKLENSVSALDVSALVVDLGGIATYPSFVANRYGLQFALSTAAEEWFHQYFSSAPLVSDTDSKKLDTRSRVLS